MLKTTALASGLLLAAALAMPSVSFANKEARLEAAFKKADKDNDGTLDKDEAKKMPRVAKHFDEIDADHDGTVSLDEIKTAMEKKKKH